MSTLLIVVLCVAVLWAGSKALDALHKVCRGHQPSSRPSRFRKDLAGRAPLGADADISPCCPRGEIPVMKRLLDRTRNLSQRQRRVVALVAQGLKNREIATKLGIGTHVVRNYVSNVYDKIGVNNRVELALWYEARRLEGPRP